MADEQSTGLAAFGARIGRLMRFTRILMCILIALVIALLAWLVMAEALGDGVSNPEPGEFPYVAVVFGTLVYAVAWWAIVGFASGEARLAWRAGTPAAIMVLAGLVSFVLDVVIVIILLN
ncbi:MAG: hypothetical protein JXA10_10670 [Anaerolineae bacterium]|nr:hypothetical protein [Anaerolineae bacterium]